MTDDDRDVHLREALRHAPDAQLQPPHALSDLILKEARAKARDASVPARGPRHPLLQVWDWFARPSVATGFASVMVATLVGLMWWDRPMDEALPHRPAPVETTVATPAPVPAPPAAPVAEAARPAQPAEPPRAPQRKSAAAAKPAPVAPPAPEAAAREEPAVPAAVGAAPAVREAAPPAALSAPPPSPASTAAADTAGAPAPARSSMARSTPADEAKRLRSVGPDDTLNKAGTKAEAREQVSRQEAEPRASLAQVRAAIAAEPGRWAWQRGNGAAQAMDDAVYAWLAQLESAAGARWQARAERDTAAALGRDLKLLRDGRVQHSLRLTERGVLWEHEQSASQAELPLPQLQGLQAALDGATP